MLIASYEAYRASSDALNEVRCVAGQIWANRESERESQSRQRQRDRYGQSDGCALHVRTGAHSGREGAGVWKMEAGGGGGGGLGGAPLPNQGHKLKEVLVSL